MGEEDKDPHRRRREEAGNAGAGHAGDAKGKGRAGVEGDSRDREAGTYMRRRRRGDDTCDRAPLPRVVSPAKEDKDPARIRRGAIAPVGQSARAEHRTGEASSPMGAGVVGPGGRADALGSNVPRGPDREERPRVVGKGAVWHSLNTYLAGASSSAAERDERGTRHRAQPEPNKAEPAQLAIRGAARQRVDSSVHPSSYPARAPPPSNAPGRKQLVAEDVRQSHTVAGSPPDRKSTRLNSSHSGESRMPSSA